MLGCYSCYIDLEHRRGVNLFQQVLQEGQNSRYVTLHLPDTFIQSDLQLHSGYTFSLVHVFPGNQTHNLLRNWRNALPLSHTGTHKTGSVPRVLHQVEKTHQEALCYDKEDHPGDVYKTPLLYCPNGLRCDTPSDLTEKFEGQNILPAFPGSWCEGDLPFSIRGRKPVFRHTAPPNLS